MSISKFVFKFEDMWWFEGRREGIERRRKRGREEGESFNYTGNNRNGKKKGWDNSVVVKF